MGVGLSIPSQSQAQPQGMGGTATGFPTTNVLPQYAAQLGSAPLAVPNPTQQMLPNQAASLASFQGAPMGAFPTPNPMVERPPTLGQAQMTESLQQMLPNQAPLAPFQGARAPTLGQATAMAQQAAMLQPQQSTYGGPLQQPQPPAKLQNLYDRFLQQQPQQLPPPQQPMRGLGGLQNYMQPNMARFLQRRARMARALPRKG